MQQLYPDSDISSDSDDNQTNDVSPPLVEEGDYFTTAEGLEYLTAEGRSVLSHLESVLHVHGSGPNGVSIIIGWLHDQIINFYFTLQVLRKNILVNLMMQIYELHCI